MRGWLSAGCALGLMSACISPRVAIAQAAGAGSNSPASNTAGSRPKTKTASSGAAATKAHSASHSAAAAHNRKSKYAASRKSGKGKTTARGQQKIDPERAQAIQEALIREHYLSGEAAGTWNQASEDAMRRYQADHGWQSKTVPDARALISLGLGPSHDHLLNPESAMTTGPAAPHAGSLSSVSPTPVSHSADPGAGVSTSTAPPADSAPAPTPEHDAAGPQ